MPVIGRNTFPYKYTPETDVPKYQQFRAEGRSLWQSVPHAIDYERKYLASYGKKRTAPEEEYTYFEKQRELWRSLAATAPPGGSSNKVKLGMVGDIMWIRDSWKTFLTDEARDRMNACDALLGNLETVVSKHYRVPCILPDTFAYNSRPELVTSFSRPDGRSSFNALSFANNHVMDKGVQGVRDTLDFLASKGIKTSGARFDPSEKPYTTFTVNGVRFGFYAATWGLNNPSLETGTPVKLNVVKGLAAAPADPKKVDLSEIRSVLDQMKKDGVDFRVVSMHWGYEFETYPEPAIMQVARDVVALGADVIMGTHPHVPQPTDVLFVNGYEKQLPPQIQRLAACQPESGSLLNVPGDEPRKALVIYSLGNFVSNCFTDLCNIGLLTHVTVTRDEKTGKVDWYLPGHDYYYMAHSDARHQRKFHPLDTWLAQPEAAESTKEEARWVRRHLEG